MDKNGPTQDESNSIDARNTQGYLNQPSGPVEQVIGDKVTGDKIAGDKVLGDKIVYEAEVAYDVRGLPNPYLGLRAFTYEDRDAYAGREALVQEALAYLTDPARPQSLLFITGDSGSGKSSFAQAGLIPALEVHYLKRLKAVRLSVFRPSSQPLATLADALSQLGMKIDPATLGQSDPKTFGQRLFESSPPDQINLLVIDQFEEFFTQSPPEPRGWVFTFLSNLPPFARLHTHLIATLRSDYLTELFQSEALWQIAKGGIELRAMDAASLRLAILGPLEACGRSDGRYRLKQFEPELLERLAQDAGQDASYLPLLQVTLEDLWQRGALTLGAYAGLGEAIRRRAEAVYAFRDFERVQPADPRPPEERAALLDLMLDQVEVSTDDDPRRDVRRRREKEDLVGDSILRGRLVEDLTRARLLAVSQEPVGDTSVETVDIIHESLIANWERMREAIAGRREHLKRRARFEASLDEWLDRGKSDDYLLSGVRLAEGHSLQKAGDIALRSDEAQDFLKRSEAQAEAAHQAELEKERRRVRTARIFTVAIGALLVIAILAAGWAGLQTNLLSQEKSTSEARRVAAEAAQATAVMQADQLLVEKSTSEARRIAAENAQATAEAEQRVSRSRELASLARLESDHSASLLLAIEAYQHLPTNQALGVLLDTLQENPHLATYLHSGYPYILNLVFSPNGSKFALIGCHDFKLSRGCAGPEMLVYDGQTVRPIGFPVNEFPKSEGTISLAFTPEGTLLASLSETEAVLFQAETGQVLDRIPSAEFDGQRDRLSISPDGGSFVIDNPEGIPLNWRYTGLDGGIQAIPGDEYAVDQYQQALYDLTTRGLLGQPVSSGGVPYLAMGFQGQQLIGVVEQDGSKLLWDVATDKPASTPVSSVNSEVSLSQDLQSAAIFNSQDGISLWDPESANLQAIQIPKEWEAGDFSRISRLALSPGGELLVLGYTGFHRSLPLDLAYGVRVFELPSGTMIGEYLEAPETGALSTADFANLEFTPDGMLAAAYTDGSIRILNPETGAIQASGNLESPGVLAFSQDGGWLAAGHRSGQISLWDASSITRIGELKGYSSPVVSLVFSPDSQLLLSSHADGSLVLWDLRFESLRGRVCRQANRDLTRDEWKQYMSAESYRSTCPAQPARLSVLPGGTPGISLPDRLIQRLPDSALPEKLQNIQPDSPPPLGQ